MKPAQVARTRESARLLVLDSSNRTFEDKRFSDLPHLLKPQDLIVVNDAATLPASLRAHSPSGAPIEIRLAESLEDGVWRAVLFGSGDWRIPTELRDPPQTLPVGATLEISRNFSAEVVAVSPISRRLVTLRFNRKGPEFWSALYTYGKPVQYSYLSDDLALWSVQTVYGGRPWSMEMPSAGRPFTWSMLLALRRRGINVAWLTHAAGLSAAGDEDVDSKLPFTEQYDIPQSTVDAVAEAKRGGSSVIAVGTTVVRALEGSTRNNNGVLLAGTGHTDLIINQSFHPRIVTGILTGVHDPGQSHFRLLRAFADEALLRRAWRHATEADYLCHEFGDSCLIV